jgi:hypothetical protein
MVYQIKIELDEITPTIWRRVQIDSKILLPELHNILQIVMGWTNSHLHQFIKDDQFYTMKLDDDYYWDEMDNIDYKNIPVSQLLAKEGDTIVYEYDFGDSWEHIITLEKVLLNSHPQHLPICLDGEMACPFEDCGGAWGYQDILDVFKKPRSKEYKNFIKELGADFDPNFFNKDQINKLLKSHKQRTHNADKSNPS